MGYLNLFLILLLVVILPSCTRRAEEAGEYNDIIITRQKNIIASFDRFDSTFVDSIANEDQIDFAFVDMQSNVKRSLLALDSIGPFNNDPILEVAARELFRTYEELIEREYRTLKDIKLMPTQSITGAIVDSSYAVQVRIHDRSKMAQEKFLLTQEEFGKKYNLVFE
jgi:hypothetical protein